MSDLGHQRALLRRALREIRVEITVYSITLAKAEVLRKSIQAKIDNALEETNKLNDSTDGKSNV